MNRQRGPADDVRANARPGIRNRCIISVSLRDERIESRYTNPAAVNKQRDVLARRRLDLRQITRRYLANLPKYNGELSSERSNVI